MTKPSQEANANKYIVRMIKRVIRVIIWGFILFLVIIVIYKLIPQLLGWAI